MPITTFSLIRFFHCIFSDFLFSRDCPLESETFDHISRILTMFLSRCPSSQTVHHQVSRLKYPLVVSIFKISSGKLSSLAVDEMISIMQEYGETVCVVGSCLSIANAELFCRGDTAIAVFPLLPLVCGHENEAGKATSVDVETMRPLLSLAGRLIALGAALVSQASLVELDILQLITQVSIFLHHLISKTTKVNPCGCNLVGACVGQ